MNPTPTTTFVILMRGRYLYGPSTPERVKRYGYAFTSNIAEAWPFGTEKAARNKARIVSLHMRWDDSVMIVTRELSTSKNI